MYPLIEFLANAGGAAAAVFLVMTVAERSMVKVRTRGRDTAVTAPQGVEAP